MSHDERIWRYIIGEYTYFSTVEAVYRVPTRCISRCNNQHNGAESDYPFCWYGCPGRIKEECFIHGGKLSANTRKAMKRLELELVHEPSLPLNAAFRILGFLDNQIDIGELSLGSTEE